MGDEEEYRVKYLDGDEEDEIKWIARAGKALVTYANGHTYEGEFNTEKLKHGHGVYSWMQMDDDSGELKKIAMYEGSYSNGKKHGVGKMTFPNGDVYHGEWKENKMDGEGTYTYAATKDVYSGSWSQGVKTGVGCYEYGMDKSKLNGVWEKGSFVSGDWVLEGAGVYKGTFSGGKPIGAGTFTFTNGVVQTGEYVAKKSEYEDEEEEDPDAPKPDPNWVGTPIYKTVLA